MTIRNHKQPIILTLAVAGLLVGGSLFYSHAQVAQEEPSGDARLDKIIEQNKEILKNQAEFKEALEKLQRDILQLRRRSS